MWRDLDIFYFYLIRIRSRGVLVPEQMTAEIFEHTTVLLVITNPPATYYAL